MRVKVPKGTKLVVFGDIHEHSEHFDKLFNEMEPSDKLIVASVGDFYDKGFGKDKAEYMVDRIRPYVKRGQAFVIKGNHELSNIRYAKKEKRMTKQTKWFDKQPLSITFEFDNRMLITMVHGGVLPSYTWDDLSTNVETCYIRQVDKNGKIVKRKYLVEDGMKKMVPASDGINWHELYDGRFGYIVSGHDSQKDGIAKFYNYSCNLDTSVYNTGKLTAQVFENGVKKELITITGKAKYPDVDEMYRLMYKGRI